MFQIHTHTSSANASPVQTPRDGDTAPQPPPSAAFPLKYSSEAAELIIVTWNADWWALAHPPPDPTRASMPRQWVLPPLVYATASPTRIPAHAAATEGAPEPAVFSLKDAALVFPVLSSLVIRYALYRPYLGLI